MDRPVLIAGDDGVPVRVREELAGAGIATVSICSAKRVRAARAAAAAGAKVVIGELGAPATWEEAGLAQARSIGVLGPDDLDNLNAALLIADHGGAAPIVVRLFSPDLAEGVERMLGGRGTVLSEIEVAGPALVQAALSGNEGQRISVAGRMLEVEEVDPDDPALVVALCAVEHPSDVLPPRERMTGHVLALVDRQSVVSGARGALPSAIAQLQQPTLPKRRRVSRRQRAAAALRSIPRRAWLLLLTILLVFGIGAPCSSPPTIWTRSTPSTSPRPRWRRSATGTTTCCRRRTG